MDGSRFGAKLYYSMEDTPLGTAGATKKAEKYLGETFLVFNGDDFMDLDFAAMIDVHKKSGAKVTIALTRVDDPTNYGVVETDASSRVLHFTEKPKPEEVTSNMVNAGAWLVEPEVMSRIPPETQISFERTVFPEMLARHEPVYAYTSHGYWMDAGTPERYLLLHRDLLSGKSKFHNVFHYPAATWADVPVIQVFVDGAAMQTQGALRSCSYAPYARVLKRICYEEDFHIRLGIDVYRALAEGTPTQRAMLQDAVDRWWQPIMHFFGPRDQASPHLETMMRWRIKVKTNDELRQQFLRQFVPFITDYGLRLPDPNLKWNEAEQRYDHSEPDWDEFKRVIRGEGPKTAARLQLRNDYWQRHHWVREAMTAWGRAA